jgi:5-methylcytosine-specific restriction endonuclease McrA
LTSREIYCTIGGVYHVYQPTVKGEKRWGYYYRLSGHKFTAIRNPRTGRPFRSEAEVRSYVEHLNDWDIAADSTKAELFQLFSDTTEWLLSAWDSLNPREKIAVLFVLYRGRCVYCGQQVHLDTTRNPGANRATLDHRIPLSAGGVTSLVNASLACHRCNCSKGSGDVEQFLHRLSACSQEGHRDLPCLSAHDRG